MSPSHFAGLVKHLQGGPGDWEDEERGTQDSGWGGAGAERQGGGRKGAWVLQFTKDAHFIPVEKAIRKGLSLGDSARKVGEGHTAARCNYQLPEAVSIKQRRYPSPFPKE